MLIGVHVSPAGGPAKAVERGVERGARSIQIFNQNPRQWKPREYSDEEVADFRAAMAESDVDALLIHAVYLLNPASEDADFRAKTLASLTTSLRAGRALGAHGGRAAPGLGAEGRRRGRRRDRARGRADRRGAGGVGEVPAAPGGHRRRGRDAGALVRGARAAARGVGRRQAARASASTRATCSRPATTSAPRTGSRPCWTSSTAWSGSTGSARCTSTTRRRRWAPTATATSTSATARSAARACAAFLSEPRFEGLPCVLEGPGAKGKGVDRDDMDDAFRMRKQGLRARR